MLFTCSLLPSQVQVDTSCCTMIPGILSSDRILPCQMLCFPHFQSESTSVFLFSFQEYSRSIQNRLYNNDSEGDYDMKYIPVNNTDLSVSEIASRGPDGQRARRKAGLPGLTVQGRGGLLGAGEGSVLPCGIFGRAQVERTQFGVVVPASTTVFMPSRESTSSSCVSKNAEKRGFTITRSPSAGVSMSGQLSELSSSLAGESGRLPSRHCR